MTERISETVTKIVDATRVSGVPGKDDNVKHANLQCSKCSEYFVVVYPEKFGNCDTIDVICSDPCHKFFIKRKMAIHYIEKSKRRMANFGNEYMPSFVHFKECKLRKFFNNLFR